MFVLRHIIIRATVLALGRADDKKERRRLKDNGNG
jgi:hypothetical protein